MSVPTPEELTAEIAAKAKVSLQLVDDILKTHGISLRPIPPTPRSITIRRLTFCGEKVNTLWDGEFEATFDFSNGVTALITDENLRGKSSVLELIAWALRGSPRRLRADVKPWLRTITLEYAVNAAPMAIRLTAQSETGFRAEVFSAADADALRASLENNELAEGVHRTAMGLSEREFASHQDELMLNLLRLEPITNWQRYPGGDQGHAQVNGWPAYFGALYLPSADSELLLGDVIFGGLPARLLQLFCNVPLMSTFIKLDTLSKQSVQDEANRTRRARADDQARAEERDELLNQLADINRQLAELPTSTGRTFQTIAAELAAAEEEFEAARTHGRQATRTLEDARAARQAEMRRRNNERETQLARMLFQGLSPKHCPRCEQVIDAQRTRLEASDHQCAVCTRGIPVADLAVDTAAADTGEQATQDGRQDTESAVDAVEALEGAEQAAEATVEAASTALEQARQLVDKLAAELIAARRSEEFTRRTELELEAARLSGRIEGIPTAASAPTPSPTGAVLAAAKGVLQGVTAQSAGQIFAELNEEIGALGIKFGIDNLEGVELDRRGGMKVITAGVEERFSRLSGGERLRLRIALVVALLRVGHRAGVGSHPGLILLDSPGSDELTVEDEAMLLRELDSLKTELRDLQVVVASAEPAAVSGNLEPSQIYSAIGGAPLW